MIVFGKLKLFIDINNRNVCLDMLVVSDETTSYQCVLGWDFLEKAGFRLVCEVGEREIFGNSEDFCKQILSIDFCDMVIDVEICE